MATKTHDTFLIHKNFEKMFLEVSPDQCQKLVRAMFRLAVDGEDTAFEDDVILDIFWTQISHFMVGNEKKYSDKCEKMSEKKRKYWEELKRMRKENKEMMEKLKQYGLAPQNPPQETTAEANYYDYPDEVPFV